MRARDNEVRRTAAKRTAANGRCFALFEALFAPASNAAEAEDMVAAVKEAEVPNHIAKADAALRWGHRHPRRAAAPTPKAAAAG